MAEFIRCMRLELTIRNHEKDINSNNWCISKIIQCGFTWFTNISIAFIWKYKASTFNVFIHMRVLITVNESVLWQGEPTTEQFMKSMKCYSTNERFSQSQLFRDHQNWWKLICKNLSIAAHYITFNEFPPISLGLTIIFRYFSLVVPLCNGHLKPQNRNTTNIQMHIRRKTILNANVKLKWDMNFTQNFQQIYYW